MNNSVSHISTAPGSLVFIGDKKMDKTIIETVQYDKESFSEEKSQVFEDKEKRLEKLWVNVYGVHDIGIIKKIGDKYKLDPLTLEDILDTKQRPKCDLYDDYLYLVLPMIRFDKVSQHIIEEQFSMILTKDTLVTFQEAEGDVLEGVRERIRKGSTRIRKKSAGYLAYAFLDAIADGYANVIEQFGDKIDLINAEIIMNHDKSILDKITLFKREISYLRKSMRPVRELVLAFSKTDYIHKDDDVFIRDLLDHLNSVTDGLETYREILSDLLHVYNTKVSNKINDIIRVLTIFSVVFIPLTFLAGLYGMNFQYMPGLRTSYGFPVILTSMVIISVSMIFYFKKKKWM